MRLKKIKAKKYVFGARKRKLALKILKKFTEVYLFTVIDHEFWFLNLRSSKTLYRRENAKFYVDIFYNTFMINMKKIDVSQTCLCICVCMCRVFFCRTITRKRLHKSLRNLAWIFVYVFLKTPLILAMICRKLPDLENIVIFA